MMRSDLSIIDNNFTGTCFFHEKSDNETMHLCKTLYLDMKGKIAQQMQNRFITKLCEGNLAAVEPKTIDLV